MIGQKNNLNIIKQWRLKRSFPRFIIIVGDVGSGRSTLAKIIAEQTNSIIYNADNGIDSVRSVINTAYTLDVSTVYLFKDCDNMSLQAKNSMLKVVEEPPNKARFIMTVKELSNVLPTIISRATVLNMSPYTADELHLTEGDSEIAYMIKTIADTSESRRTSIMKACELSERVIVHIANKSMTGVLHELTKLQQKDNDGGVEPELFMRAFRHQISHSSIPAFAIFMFLPHIVKCCADIKRTALNKKSCVEVMCINIVEEYKNYEG